MAGALDFKFKHRSVADEHSALKYHAEHKPNLETWLFDGDGPIFVDTNVLLNLYRISFFEREQLLRFFQNQKERIVLCSQVCAEYLNHRHSDARSVKSSFDSLIKDADKLKQNLLDNLRSSREQIRDFQRKPSITHDQKDVCAHLAGLLHDMAIETEDGGMFLKIDTLFEEINKALTENKARLIQGVDYEYDDPILATVSTLKALPELPDDERSQVETFYHTLLDEFNKHKEREDEKLHHSFPGCGDRGKLRRGGAPEGDFVIFHEMLRYMTENNTDAIFITRDVTKSDWLMPNGRPFVHYIVNIYKATGHMLYIMADTDLIPLSMRPAVEDGTTSDDTDTPASSQPESHPQDDKTYASASEEPADSEPETRPEEIPDPDEPKAATPEAIGLTQTHSRFFRDITPDRFLRELTTALKWAEGYGSGFVNKKFFIYDILGSKRFYFKTSDEMCKTLVEAGKVEETEETHDGNRITVLKLR